MAFLATQLGENTEGVSQCSGKSTSIPTRLVPITTVRI